MAMSAGIGDARGRLSVHGVGGLVQKVGAQPELWLRWPVVRGEGVEPKGSEDCSRVLQ